MTTSSGPSTHKEPNATEIVTRCEIVRHVRPAVTCAMVVYSLESSGEVSLHGGPLMAVLCSPSIPTAISAIVSSKLTWLHEETEHHQWIRMSMVRLAVH